MCIAKEKLLYQECIAPKNTRKLWYKENFFRNFYHSKIAK